MKTAFRILRNSTMVECWMAVISSWAPIKISSTISVQNARPENDKLLRLAYFFLPVC